MERIEEFTRDGKNFIYFDLSELQSNDEFVQIIEESKSVIRKHEEGSLCTITNIANIRFDSKTKEILVDWMEHNKPYVKYGAVIGIDGIKKIFISAAFALSGRKNMSYVPTKEEAIQWLLKRK